MSLVFTSEIFRSLTVPHKSWTPKSSGAMGFLLTALPLLGHQRALLVQMARGGEAEQRGEASPAGGRGQVHVVIRQTKSLHAHPGSGSGSSGSGLIVCSRHVNPRLLLPSKKKKKDKEGWKKSPLLNNLGLQRLVGIFFFSVVISSFIYLFFHPRPLLMFSWRAAAAAAFAQWHLVACLKAKQGEPHLRTRPDVTSEMVELRYSLHNSILWGYIFAYSPSLCVRPHTLGRK